MYRTTATTLEFQNCLIDFDFAFPPVIIVFYNREFQAYTLSIIG